ncbi:uncharacterized protein N7483_007677 [Penicillium malachiteum]|uniref:uncharacterized protein n=1 Tax=Penicillium malachiteum TaxID=1324776 RepID=UPI002548C3B3|nr:uncharacterized protein N7483_007677 [Penicillium malachiteum]KAJ5726320.1 hypothetical protein N7483_007677 [Penicillium malachiteum]
MDLTARDLVYSPIPGLKVGESKTTSSSTHALEFKSHLVHWTGFQNEVREASNGIDWNRFPAVLASSPNRDVVPSHTCFEQWRCGDEISVTGRFGQNVDHVMRSVFHTLGIPVWVGDYKICRRGSMPGKYPILRWLMITISYESWERWKLLECMT